MFDSNKGLYIAHGPQGPICIQGRMANRHGLIAGATGTGKTVSLRCSQKLSARQAYLALWQI